MPDSSGIPSTVSPHVVFRPFLPFTRDDVPDRASVPRRGVILNPMRTLALLGLCAAMAAGQTPQPAPDRANILRGEYGRYRANNDLLYYHLDVKVEPDKKFLSGTNTIRFKMLNDDTRIQLDLHPALKVEGIVMAGTPLKYERELSTVWVDFPDTLRAGREYTIDFQYSGNPAEGGRFGGITFKK